MVTLASTLLALFVAVVLGLLLGRAATQWFSGRGLSNLLVEMRGAFLPFLAAPLLSEHTGLSTWVVVGIVVGLMQGVAVARWVARRNDDWAPGLRGEIALGRSRAALASALGTKRGAVTATLATTGPQVILVEYLLSALGMPTLDVSGSLGGALQRGAPFSFLVFLIVGALLLICTEALIAWAFLERGSKG